MSGYVWMWQVRPTVFQRAFRHPRSATFDLFEVAEERPISEVVGRRLKKGF